MNTEAKNSVNGVEEEKKGFRIHRTVYLCVISLLAFVNLQLTPELIWFVFPLTGWGIGLTIHYLAMRHSVLDSGR